MATKMMSCRLWKYHAKFKRVGLYRMTGRYRKIRLQIWDNMMYARSRWRP